MTLLGSFQVSFLNDSLNNRSGNDVARLLQENIFFTPPEVAVAILTQKKTVLSLPEADRLKHLSEPFTEQTSPPIMKLALETGVMRILSGP